VVFVALFVFFWLLIEKPKGHDESILSFLDEGHLAEVIHRNFNFM